MTMRNYVEPVKRNHNPNWPYSPDHPYRILIFDCSGSGKTNVTTEPNKTSTTRCSQNLFVH